MKPEQQRIKIAEARGWTNVHGGESDGGLYLRGHPPKNRGLAQVVPDYPFDLNAIHDVRALIRDDVALRVKYLNTLRNIVGQTCEKNKMGQALVSDFHLLDATAAQHAEALLRTLNLWTES
jgi:hypothetical protein